MLKIYKGNMVLEVPKGSYKSIYAPSGWAVVEDTPVEPPQEPSPAPVEGEDSNTTPNQEPSPEAPQEDQTPESEDDVLSKMSESELRQYASLLGIKVRDFKTKDKLVKAIKAHQE